MTSVASGMSLCFNASSAPSSRNSVPLVDAITGSTTSGMSLAYFASVSATARAISAEPSMPILIASAPMSARQRSICSRTISGGIEMDRVDRTGVLHGHRGQRRHGVTAERSRRFDVSLDAGAAGRIRAGDDKNARGLAASPLGGDLLDRSDDVVDYRTDQLLVVAFGHHTDNRFRSRLAHQHAA